MGFPDQLFLKTSVGEKTRAIQGLHKLEVVDYGMDHENDLTDKSVCKTNVQVYDICKTPVKLVSKDIVPEPVKVSSRGRKLKPVDKLNL